MPFLTEEIWHAFYEGKPPQRSIALAHYPRTGTLDTNAEVAMSRLQALIVAARDLRRASGVPEKETVPIQVRASATIATLLRSNSLIIIERLGRVSSLEFVDGFAEDALLRSTPDFDLTVLYEKQIDVVAERERLIRELARMEKEQGNAERQLGNEAFLGKAPAAVVEGLKSGAAELAVLIPKTREALDRLSES